MAIEFGCPVCGGTLRVEDDAVGQVVRCGGCLTMLRVPDADPAPPSFPRSPASPFPGSPDSLSPDAPRPTPTRSPAAKPPEKSATPGDRLEEQPRPPRRRRVRREPPPPTGRSPFFWAIIVVGVIGFGSCVMCCGLISLKSDTKWQTYNSSKGGFKVDLPAKQKNNMQLRGLNLDPNFKVEGTHLWPPGEDFAVLHKDIDSSRKREGDNEETFKSAVKDLVSSGLTKEGDGTELEANGFPAKEIRFHNAKGGSYLVRIIVADTRMYILLVGGQMTDAHNNNVQRFIHSFSVSDENERLLKGEELGRTFRLGKFLAENSFNAMAEDRVKAKEQKRKAD